MIRFQRIGRKNDPSFRMAVLEKTAGPKAGKFIDLVGNYNPKTKAFNANKESIVSWIGKGAQLSPSLMNLLISKGILEGKKINVLPKKTPIKKDVVEEVAAPAAAPVAEAVEETPVQTEAPVAEAEAEVAAVEEPTA